MSLYYDDAIPIRNPPETIQNPGRNIYGRNRHFSLDFYRFLFSAYHEWHLHLRNINYNTFAKFSNNLPTPVCILWFALCTGNVQFELLILQEPKNITYTCNRKAIFRWGRHAPVLLKPNPSVPHLGPYLIGPLPETHRSRLIKRKKERYKFFVSQKRRTFVSLTSSFFVETFYFLNQKF